MERHVLLTPPEAAEFLRVSLLRLYALARSNAVPSVRLGRSLRFDEEALRRFVQNGGTSSQTPDHASPDGRIIGVARWNSRLAEPSKHVGERGE